MIIQLAVTGDAKGNGYYDIHNSIRKPSFMVVWEAEILTKEKRMIEETLCSIMVNMQMT